LTVESQMNVSDLIQRTLNCIFNADLQLNTLTKSWAEDYDNNKTPCRWRWGGDRVL